MLENIEGYLSKLLEDTNEDTNNEEKNKIIEKSLAIALDLRKFEIDLYWKRTTYFWGMNAALLALYGVLLTSKREVDITFLAIVPAFGIILSACWYYLNSGGKFWQENWEMHTNYLSSYINGNLSRMIPKENNNRFSVSKINMTFSMMICVLWIFVLSYILAKYASISIFFSLKYFIPLLILILGIIVIISILLTYPLESSIRSQNKNDSYIEFDDQSY